MDPFKKMKPNRLLALRLGLLAALTLLASCATSQGRHVPIENAYPAQSETHNVDIFFEGVPPREFDRIARLDVHLEKTFFVRSALEDALPELKRQARLSGADAIIEFREISSQSIETRIYHVTATAIRYRQ